MNWDINEPGAMLWMVDKDRIPDGKWWRKGEVEVVEDEVGQVSWER